MKQKQKNGKFNNCRYIASRQKNRFVFEHKEENLAVAAPSGENAGDRVDAGASLEGITSDILTRVETALQNPEALQLQEQLNYILANTPATTVLQILADKNALSRVEEKLVPYAMRALQEYAASLAPDAPRIESLLNKKEQLYLALLRAKDPFTAEHCVDVFIAAHKGLKISGVKEKVDDEQRDILLHACLLHDCGKEELPNIVLLNPVSRDAQASLYGRYVAQKERPPLQSPLRYGDEADAEPAESHNRLLQHPEQFPDEELGKAAEQFIAECKKTRFDPRIIPLQALLEGSALILEKGESEFDAMTRPEADFAQIIPALERRIEQIRAGKPLDFEQEAVTICLLEAAKNLQKNPYAKNTVFHILKDQSEALSLNGGILKHYRISPTATFKDAIDIHERASVELTASANNVDTSKRTENIGLARVLRTIGLHHANQVTKGVRDTLADTQLFPAAAEKDIVLYNLIRICDLIAALNQKRPYFQSQAAKPTALIAKILREEVAKGFIDGTITELFINNVLSAQ